jgi:hypothetical protein
MLREESKRVWTLLRKQNGPWRIVAVRPRGNDAAPSNQFTGKTTPQQIASAICNLMLALPREQWREVIQAIRDEGRAASRRWN